MSNRLTRRDFLKVGCGATVATLLACGGLGYAGTLPPDIPMDDTTVKGTGTMSKILVTYATRAGSTIEVAQTIAQTLGATGATVNVRPVKNVKDIKGYDALVIGSAIRMGQWFPEAVQFVKNNQPILTGIPVAYFLVSGYLKDDTPEMRKRSARTSTRSGRFWSPRASACSRARWISASSISLIALSPK